MKRQIPIWLVVAIAIVIVAAAGYFAGIRPKRAEVSKLDEKIASLEIEVEAAKRIAEATGEEPGAQIKVADLVRLAKAMPDEVDMAGIILELNAAAAEAGVEFASIQPTSLSPRDGYTVLPITLTFEGNYYDLTELLFHLRTLVTVREGVLDANGRLFTIDSLTLQEGTEGFPSVLASLTVSAYQYGVDPDALAQAVASGALPAPAETGATAPGETTGEADTGSTEPASTESPAAPAAPVDGAQQAEGGTP